MPGGFSNGFSNGFGPFEEFIEIILQIQQLLTDDFQIQMSFAKGLQIVQVKSITLER